MKRITFLVFLTIFVVLLAGCQSEQAQPTATAMPVVEATAPAAPTVEPTAELTALPTAETDGLGALTANPWQWVSFTDPLQQFEVETPESYLLTFNEDGTVAIKADCNNASGSYTASEDGSLTIEVGPMTRAACPPGSRSDQFVGLLDGAARTFFDNGNLYLDLFADGGTMVFTTVDEAAMVDDGEGSLAGALPEELAAQLDAFLQSQVYSEGGYARGAAPGLVLFVDTPEGRYANAAGVSSLEEGTPMQADDRLEIGSNSKSFLIVVLMQLQEEGVLTLDDMLGDWLADLAEQIPNGDEITLRQLAAHTAGIWDYGDPIIGEAATDPDKLEEGYTPEELVLYAIDNGTPDFAPGAAWKYSNTGYILLGMIAEKATGQSLADLYQERIFDPLDLETAVLIEGVPQEGEITTQGYWWQEEDGTRLNTTGWNASQGWAAGALAMTAEDLAIYGEALAAGELFQDPDSLAQMLAFNEQALPIGGAPFGLGLIDFGNGYWGHEGQTAGFQSLWFTNPDAGVTVVGLTNSAAYSAYGFLNVINILEDSGLQPFQPVTLLPVADEAPAAFTSKWAWVLAKQGSETADIPPGVLLALAKDGTATVLSSDCGQATGTFMADPESQLALDLDRSAVTCTGGEPLVQLLEVLDAADTWRFENGRLVITVAEGAGEIVLEVPLPGEEMDTGACPAAELPFPRPEPAYSGKLERDLAPFSAALAAYTPEQAEERAELVSGKTIPELQALMASGDLTAVDLLVYYLDRIQRFDIDRLN
jgi:D-alanyl-D-alanine carboxypeptidase